MDQVLLAFLMMLILIILLSKIYWAIIYGDKSSFFKINTIFIYINNYFLMLHRKAKYCLSLATCNFLSNFVSNCPESQK